MGFIKDLTKGGAQATEFARALVKDIEQRYPPAIDQDSAKRPSVNRLTRIVEDVCDKATVFARDQRLGVLGKAKLGNALRWELTDKGYRQDFVDLATEAVVVKLSQPAGRS